jgi:hypothetical protein
MGQHTTNKTPPFQVNRSAGFSEDEGGRDRVVPVAVGVAVPVAVAVAVAVAVEQ